MSAQQAFPTQMEGEYLCEPRHGCNSSFKIFIEADTSDTTRFFLNDSCTTFRGGRFNIPMTNSNSFNGNINTCHIQGRFYPNLDSLDAFRLTPGCGSGCSCGLEYKCKKVITSLSKNKLHSILLYPNPVKEELVLKGISEKVTFRLHNVQGQLLKNGFISTQHPIQVNELPPGIYLLQLGEGKEQLWRKVVKE